MYKQCADMSLNAAEWELNMSNSMVYELNRCKYIVEGIEELRTTNS